MKTNQLYLDSKELKEIKKDLVTFDELFLLKNAPIEDGDPMTSIRNATFNKYNIFAKITKDIYFSRYGKKSHIKTNDLVKVVMISRFGDVGIHSDIDSEHNTYYVRGLDPLTDFRDWIFKPK